MYRRDVRPWLGLKMIDLNEMIIAKEKEREPLFPNVSKGTLVHMVSRLLIIFAFDNYYWLESIYFE